MTAMDLTMDALQQEQVSHWLGVWHAWSATSERCARGYAGVSAGFGLYRSRARHDAGDDLDAAAELAEARSVDEVVQRLADPWRTALHVEARNIHAPARVWASARIHHEDLQRVVTEARRMLWHGMVARGLA